MKNRPWKPNLVPTALLTFTLLAAISLFSVVTFSRSFLTIERASQQIYDVAMPKIFDAQRQIRMLERLSNQGRALIYIDSRELRTQIRQQLDSIAMDGVLQGEEDTRQAVANAFVVIDANLDQINREGASARGAALARWAPIELELSDRAEAVTAAASTSAADDVDSILTAIANTRQNGAGALAMLGFTMAIGLALFLWLIVEPITRLTRALTLAREGYQLEGGSQRLHEMQLLDDAAVALAKAHREIEERRAGLESEANTDTLTRLANRRRLEYVANIEIARAIRYARPLSVLAIDIDHFKRINDSYGHHNGDIVLRALADFLLETCRTQDLPVRLGGEEFAVLLPETDLSGAALAAERVRSGCEALRIALQDGQQVRITVSVGASQLRPDDSNLHMPLQRADRALYAAKQGGRNRCEMEPKVQLRPGTETPR